MSREKNVVEYYMICNKLKDVIRTGWLNWNVSKERLESVAEHIFGVQMLAIAMHSEYQYDLDLKKIIFMLAIHELGETLIGDLTLFQINKEEKAKIEHEAVSKILKGLIAGEEIEKLFLEFDNQTSKEAIFAFQCDKLECDLQCKIYDEQGYVDLNSQENNDIMQDSLVNKLLKDGTSWSTMWLKFSQERYHYDSNFLKVSNYVLNNKITK